MITIWCITDSKPGHLAQLNGLVAALQSLLRIRCYFFESSGSLGNVRSLEKPDLIFCAGHRTHWRALTLKWRFKAKLVVLMKPSLPKSWFDLCIIPEHDGVSHRDNLIFTKGVLNTIEPQQHADKRKGLILIGGPSKHYQWCNETIIKQLTALIAVNPAIDWQLTTSRRTPADFIPALSVSLAQCITVFPVEETDKAWLYEQYQNCAVIWVTADSVSMIYESLSSGAQVGLIDLPIDSADRVVQGVQSLQQQGYLTSLPHYCQQQTMLAAKPPLQEADRVAEIVLQRFDLDV